MAVAAARCVRDGVLLSFPTWRWTSFCDHAATSLAVLFRSSFSTLGVVPQLQFIDRVCFLVVNRDR